MSSDEASPGAERRVLIASANPLFALGLQRMVAERWGKRGAEIRLAGSMQEATASMEEWKPDLIIVDYDDVGKPGSIQREALLGRFITEKRPMQVMLVSLRESGEVVVYDRRTLTPDQAEDWLDLPWEPAQEIVESSKLSRSGNMRHFVIVGLLTIVLSVVVYFLLTSAGLIPTPASTQALIYESQARLQVALISFLFSLIVSFMGYSIVVFRQKPGETGDGPHIKGSTRLEIVWTILPLALVIYLSFIGSQALGEMIRPEPQALEVKVIGFQWSWLFEYPEYGIQSPTLYLPVDRQVRLLMTSRDVIHSFWVPEFGTKQDVLPGANLVKELRITPNRIGDYKVRCAEMCGGAHAYMESPVKVVSQQDYNAWIEEQLKASNASPAERGQRVSANNCLSCHSIDGSKMLGPTWQGLYGSEVQLADGSKVIADEAYILESIVDPNAKIHQGYPPGVMPATYTTLLTEQQINDIVEFIKTLE